MYSWNVSTPRLLPLLVAAVLGALLVLSRPAEAQDSPIAAEVDSSQVPLYQELTLTVTVTGSISMPEPNLPPIDWATVDGPSRVPLLIAVNNVTSSQVLNYYKLYPTDIGEHTIGPISVEVGGQTYETEPIQVVVTRAGAAQPSARATPRPLVLPVLRPADEQDAYLVSAEVDNPTPYVGQQVTYTFRFLGALGPFARPRNYETPDFTGFWHRQGPFQRVRETVSGRSYWGMESGTLLFPAVAGPVTIEPASITLPPNMGGQLETDPVDLEVRPLPEGSPDGFQGAVGDYQVAASITSGRAAANEPLTLALLITGRGNLEALPEPAMPEMSGWRSFDGESSFNTQITDGEMMGARSIERVYVPTAPGEFTIPSIPFSFFDPFAKEYRTILTEPIPLTVAPSLGQESAPLPSDRDEVERLGEDIRHIKPVPGELRPSESPITGDTAYRLGWAAPLAALALAAGLKLHRRRRRDPVAARQRAAYRNAMRGIQSPGATAGPADTAGAVLSAYLGDVLGQGVAGMTQAALADALSDRGASEALVRRVLDALSLAEGARFAPGIDPAGDSLLEKVRELITDLEQEVNR